MSQTDIKIILVMMWVNIIFNYWILRKQISDINTKFYKLEKLLIMHEIEEARKENKENTLQK